MNLNLLKPFDEKFGTKVFAAFTISIFVLSTSFTAFFIRHQRKSMTDAMIKNGKLLVGILAYNSRIGVFSENEALLKDPVDGIFKQEGVLEVVIFNPKGKVLKRQKRTGRQSLPKESLFQDGANGDKILHRLKEDGVPFYLEGTDDFEFWSPVLAGSGFSTEDSLFWGKASFQKKDRMIGYVRITIGKQMHNERLRALLSKSVFMGGIFLMIGAFVVYFIVKGITRPLNRLTEGVRALGMGGVVQTVPVETRDEIGRLAQAFNKMYESLRSREAEKKQLEEQLRHAQKMEAIGTLAGGIAHDFNNLLMAIQGNASLMLLDIDARHPHYEKIKNIEKYIRNGADLTGQLLGFSRGGKYQVEPTDINAMIAKSSEMFGRTKKEVCVHKKFQKNICMVEVDRGQIEQVLLNLFLNAWHAMPGGGDLYIETESVTIEGPFAESHEVTSGRYARISVRDTGVGMDEATQRRIFEPFFTTKEMGRGVGLGLASAYGIIKNHRGIIEVQSKKGQGTTFNIYLPASNKALGKGERGHPKLLQGEELVLLVDDEEMIIDVGKRLLEKIGYKVWVARSGTEALETFQKNQGKIDLVILDMVMPDINGGEVYRRMKKMNPKIRALLSSGYSIDGRAAKIMEMGCDAFIQKPFDAHDLSQKIRQIMEKP